MDRTAVEDYLRANNPTWTEEQIKRQANEFVLAAQYDPSFSINYADSRVATARPVELTQATVQEARDLLEYLKGGKGSATPAAVLGVKGKGKNASSNKDTANNSEKIKSSLGNNRILNDGEIQIGPYKRISLDVETGGSGKVNIHLQVGGTKGTKYFYNDTTGSYVSENGTKLPNSIAKNPKIQDATKKALKRSQEIQGK